VGFQRENIYSKYINIHKQTTASPTILQAENLEEGQLTGNK
jgi:hypothetical protein